MRQTPAGPPSEGPEPWDDVPSAPDSGSAPGPSSGWPSGPPYGPVPGSPYGPPPGSSSGPPGPPYGPVSGSPYGPSGPPYGPVPGSPSGPPQGAWPPLSGGPPSYGAAPPYGPPPAPRGRRGLVVGLIGGFVVLLVCVTVTAILLTRDDGSAGRPAALPAGVTVTMAADGAVTMVKPGAGTTVVDVYEDFQCPACKEFHRINDVTLKDLAREGRAKVVYHPIVLFGEEPLAGNSTRAAAAARCVTDAEHWPAYQDQLFAHQPDEGSTGFGVADLVSYGTAAGVTGSDFASCVRTQRYAARVRQESRTTLARAHVLGTPTVKVNDVALSMDETMTAEGLRGAVVAAG